MVLENGLEDRRVQKTKNLLHNALGSLIREKPFDAIAVKEILHRANVGRSTFYMHFRDKDELLVSSIHELLRSVYSQEFPAAGKSYDRILRFSLPIFEHIYRHRQLGTAHMGKRGRDIIHERLEKVIEELITEDVRKVCQSHRGTALRISPDVLVQFIASTFILVLNWWVDNRSSSLPVQIDAVFRSLVLPTLTSIYLV